MGKFIVRIMQGLLALGTLVVLAAVLAGGGVVAFQAQYAERVYPGTHVLGIDLGGMTRAEAEQALHDAFTYSNDVKFTFRADTRTWTATPGQLGVQLDAAASVDQAMLIGRQGDTIEQLNDQGYALWYRVDLAPVVVFDAGKAAAFLDSIAGEVNQPPYDAAITVNGTDIQYRPGSGGVMLDREATLVQMNVPVAGLRTAEIPLIVKPVPATLLDAEAAYLQARTLIGAPITLINTEPLSGDVASTWTLTPDQLAGMLIVSYVRDEAGPRYEARLDDNQLRAFVAPITPLFERETGDARYIFNDETAELEVIKAATPGRTLNVTDTLAAIQAGAATADGRRVGFVFTVTQPKYNDKVTAAELGIKELLTQQTTFFAGSSVDRATNVRVAAERFHGVIVAPGEEFSFNKYLGDVSLESGFAEALIIYNGRTIKGVGGGVCQVSTTLFRASFYAGLPTVVRWPHAYRVGWYERGFGPGLDATVFAPEVDFRFKNDTSAHILIEAYPYMAGGTLTFKLYGVKDRDVVVDGPFVANVIGHPADRYEENAGLPTGTIKQTDYAVDGADVTISRTVTRNGVELFTDRVFTRYIPWQAVYEYGPGTALPTPEPTPGPEPTPEP